MLHSPKCPRRLCDNFVSSESNSHIVESATLLRIEFSTKLYKFIIFSSFRTTNAPLGTFNFSFLVV